MSPLARRVRRIVRLLFWAAICFYIWVGLSALETMQEGWPVLAGSAAVVALVIGIALLQRRFDQAIDIKDPHVEWEQVVADEPENPYRSVRGGERSA
jgi:hypothetical protein